MPESNTSRHTIWFLNSIVKYVLLQIKTTILIKMSNINGISFIPDFHFQFCYCISVQLKYPIWWMNEWMELNASIHVLCCREIPSHRSILTWSSVWQPQLSFVKFFSSLPSINMVRLWCAPKKNCEFSKSSVNQNGKLIKNPVP